MKLKDGFITHETYGEQIMVSAGNVKFSGLVRSNRTAAFIVDCLKSETSETEIIEKMSEIEPEKLKARYKLDSLGEEPLETMEMIGRKRGFILGRNELDYTRIAKTVLNEFREGKLGQITLEVPEDIEEA